MIFTLLSSKLVICIYRIYNSGVVCSSDVTNIGFRTFVDANVNIYSQLSQMRAELYRETVKTPFYINV